MTFGQRPEWKEGCGAGRGIQGPGSGAPALEAQRWWCDWDGVGWGQEQQEAVEATQRFAGCDEDLEFSLSVVGRGRKS